MISNSGLLFGPPCALVGEHGFYPHLYANDTKTSASVLWRLYVTLSVVCVRRRCLLLLDAVCLQWMPVRRSCCGAATLVASINFLKLPPRSISTGFTVPSSSVRDLSIFTDADFSLRTHVQRTVAGCFAALRHFAAFGDLFHLRFFNSGCCTRAV